MASTELGEVWDWDSCASVWLFRREASLCDAAVAMLGASMPVMPAMPVSEGYGRMKAG